MACGNCGSASARYCNPVRHIRERKGRRDSLEHGGNSLLKKEVCLRTRAANYAECHRETQQSLLDDPLHSRITAEVQPRLAEREAAILRREVVAGTEDWAKVERAGLVVGDVEKVLRLEVGAAFPYEPVPRARGGECLGLGHDIAREKDDEEEKGQEEPDPVRDAKRLAVEARDGLLEVGAHHAQWRGWAVGW